MVVVGLTTGRQLLAAAEKLKGRLRAAFEKMLQCAATVTISVTGRYRPLLWLRAAFEKMLQCAWRPPNHDTPSKVLSHHTMMYLYMDHIPCVCRYKLRQAVRKLNALLRKKAREEEIARREQQGDEVEDDVTDDDDDDDADDGGKGPLGSLLGGEKKKEERVTPADVFSVISRGEPTIELEVRDCPR